MNWLNSLIARIWGPFGLMAASLLLLVGIYIPQQQAVTLREFQVAELDELVKTMAINISVAGKYDDWSRLSEIFGNISERPSLEFAALILESDGQQALVASNPPDITMASVIELEQNPLLVRAPFEGGAFNGIVVVLGSEAYLDSELARLNLPLQIAMALVVIAVVFLYFFLARRVSQPLRVVREVAESIREGDLTTPVDGDTRIWELRSLNLALDRLRSGLLEQRRTNEALTRGMEQEIQRQTKDLRKTLDELQDSRNLFGSVIESALDAMVIADGKSRIVEWNRKAEQIFGWSREEAIGQALDKLIIPHVHREDHNKGMEHYHSSGKGPVLNKLFQTQALRRDGEVFEIELFITAVQIGKEEVFSSFIRDITESKKLSRDLERQRELNSELLNGLPMLISLKDVDLKYTFVNDRALEALEQDRGNMIGRRENEVFETYWVEDSMKLDRAVWNGEKVAPTENTLQREGDTQHFLIGRYLISVGRENPTSYLLTYGFEISQLKAVQQQLETALSTKDEFLATVSHEIRTPLHSIIVLADLLNQSNREEEHAEFAENIQSSSRHLLELVNDILDFSKASAKRIELAPQPLAIEQFVSGMNRVETGVRLGTVSFRKDAEGLEGVTVMADRMRLNQILQNLLSNAFKFTEEGEVCLRVRGARNGDRFDMEWAVIDQGIGISAEDQERVLHAFEQAHSGISRKFGGTGLGLGITTKLLRLMDSELEIESTLGQGATFRFKLSFPIVEPADQKQDMDSTKGDSISGMRMLYVEDMLPNQMVMKAMCKPWNLQLTIASSGKEAIETCREHTFDLVLMDIQMPEMDGIETLKVLKSEDILPSHVPVHAFTAHAGDDERDRYLQLGFAGVLTKPLTPQELKQFLNEHPSHVEGYRN